MKLHHLRSFSAVIEQASISDAARRLSLTPSTVSAHIKALEIEYGIELFKRTHRGVELTDAGRRLEGQARLVLQTADAFAAQAQAIRTQITGSLRLALSVSSRVFDLSGFVRRLAQDYPDIGLQLFHAESAKVLQALEADAADMGIIYGDTSAASFRSDALAPAELIVAFPREWASKMDPSWEACATLPWINTGDDCPYQALSRRLFARHNMQPPQYLRVDDNQTRRQLIASGFGMSLLERGETDHPDNAIMKAEPLACPVSLLSSTHRQFEPVIKAARSRILNAY